MKKLNLFFVLSLGIFLSCTSYLLALLFILPLNIGRESFYDTDTKILSFCNQDLSKEDFAKLTRFRRLQELYLCHARFPGSLLESLGEIKSLRRIKLDDTGIRDLDLTHLASIPGLEVLELRNTGIGDAGFEQIARIKSLRMLFMSNTCVTDRGLMHLKNLKLKRLELSITGISDNSLNLLEGQKSLEYLDIQGTEISREGVERLRRSLPACRVF